MPNHERRAIVPLLILSIVLPLLFTTLAGASDAALFPRDFTPTVYVHLPFVVRPPDPSLIPPDDLSNEQAIADLINGQRGAHGLAALPQVPELVQASRRHSRDMADNNFTGHTGSDGSNAGQRMQEAGYEWAACGEIIGWGFGGDPARMVDWWMNSPTHRAIILSGSYQHFGVGYAVNHSSDWGHYWTVDFGIPATAARAASPAPYVCTFTVGGPDGGSSIVLHSSQPCQ
jgi:uncharacterized protein YkwD